ncbi:MAG: hypothetical protein KJ967_02905 [Elusimicrobia bacterium]|nr:hypothetical protein [Elusimicrobiota bacterium]
MSKIILLFLFLQGCATMSHLPPEQRREIQERKFSEKYEKVFKAVVRTLEDKGYILDKVDKETGLISTEWSATPDYSKQFLVFGKIRGKFTAHIERLDKNNTLVRLNFSLQERPVTYKEGKTTYDDTSWDDEDLDVDRAKKYYKTYFDSIQEYIK